MQFAYGPLLFSFVQSFHYAKNRTDPNLNFLFFWAIRSGGFSGSPYR